MSTEKRVCSFVGLLYVIFDHLFIILASLIQILYFVKKTYKNRGLLLLDSSKMDTVFILFVLYYVICLCLLALYRQFVHNSATLHIVSVNDRLLAKVLPTL